jgi:uncharacterized membrane protein YfcA
MFIFSSFFIILRRAAIIYYLMEPIFLAIIFFFIAAVYSSAGMGGGSMYIAILLAVGIGAAQAKPLALVCNIIVVSVSSINYRRAGYFPDRSIIPLVALSVPMAMIGGYMDMRESVYFLLTGSVLFLAATLMLLGVQGRGGKGGAFLRKNITLLGGLIGGISGLIGIGGGIFLSPVLHLIKWDKVQIIGATTAFFILVNSVAALGGIIIRGVDFQVQQTLYLGICVFSGGQLGNRLNLHFLTPWHIRFITAVIVGFVGLRLLYSNIYQ